VRKLQAYEESKLTVTQIKKGKEEDRPLQYQSMHQERKTYTGGARETAKFVIRQSRSPVRDFGFL